MAQFVNVSFTGSAGTALSTHDANWIKHTSYGTGSVILSDANRARRNTNNTSMYWYDSAPAGADYKVKAPLFAKETNGGASNTGVCGRVNPAANTMYLGRYGGGTTDAWQVFKIDGGVATQLGSNSSQTLTDETAYDHELWMTGTSIELYKEGSGTPTISVTDSAISAAGYSGMRFVGTTESDTAGLHIGGPFIAEDIGGSGSTGTSATTNADDTSSASGTTTVTGASATTNAGDTSSAAGATTVPGVSATTNAGDTSSASGEAGASGPSGSSATTNGNDAGAAAGTTTVTGTSAAANANDAPSASGTTTVVGTGAAASGNDIAAASGVAGAITGASATTNANDAATATGTAAGGIGAAPSDDDLPARKRRWVVRNGDELLVFDSAAKAEAAQQAIDAWQAKQPAKPARGATNGRRAVPKVQPAPANALPAPQQAINVPDLRGLAVGYGMQAVYDQAIALRDLERAAALWQQLRAEEEEAERMLLDDQESLAAMVDEIVAQFTALKKRRKTTA